MARFELATSGLEVLRAIQVAPHRHKLVSLSGGVEPPALRLTAARFDQLSYKSYLYYFLDLLQMISFGTRTKGPKT